MKKRFLVKACWVDAAGYDVSRCEEFDAENGLEAIGLAIDAGFRGSLMAVTECKRTAPMRWQGPSNSRAVFGRRKAGFRGR